MSVEENKAIVRRLVEEGWTNPDILDEIVAADVIAPVDIRSLDAYKKSFSNQSDLMVIEPTSDFFNYFKDTAPRK